MKTKLVVKAMQNDFLNLKFHQNLHKEKILENLCIAKRSKSFTDLKTTFCGSNNFAYFVAHYILPSFSWAPESKMIFI
jgi:hypothetical protein